jgi:hypothetical protein
MAWIFLIDILTTAADIYRGQRIEDRGIQPEK